MSQSRLVRTAEFKHDFSVSYWTYRGVDVTVELNGASNSLTLTFSSGSHSTRMEYVNFRDYTLHIVGGDFSKEQVEELRNLIDKATWAAATLHYSKGWKEFDVGIQSPGDRQPFPVS